MSLIDHVAMSQASVMEIATMRYLIKLSTWKINVDRRGLLCGIAYN